MSDHPEYLDPALASSSRSPPPALNRCIHLTSCLSVLKITLGSTTSSPNKSLWGANGEGKAGLGNQFPQAFSVPSGRFVI